jgi:hypothetical protein
VALAVGAHAIAAGAPLGREVAVARHLVEDEEFRLGIGELLSYGKLLFNANFTD